MAVERRSRSDSITLTPPRSTASPSSLGLRSFTADGVADYAWGFGRTTTSNRAECDRAGHIEGVVQFVELLEAAIDAITRVLPSHRQQVDVVCPDDAEDDVWSHGRL